MSHTACLRACALLAESSDTPLATKARILALFGAAALLSTFGLFASNETLKGLSGIIGTKNPLIARVACVFGALVGWGAVVAVVASFFGKG